MKRFLTLLAIFAITVFSTNTAFASENVINSLKISSSDNTYNIILNTKNKTQFKYAVNTQNKITLVVKNTIKSDNFNTVFDGASKIGGVIIEPSGKNLIININGQNISNSQVIVNSQNKNSITILNKIQDKTSLPVICFILCAILLTKVLFRREESDNAIGDTSKARELGLIKNVIESITNPINSSIPQTSVAYQKLNTLKSISKLEKQFAQNDKIIYKSPARSKLGGMTDVCTTKIMSPNISDLEKTKVNEYLKIKS